MIRVAAVLAEVREKMIAQGQTPAGNSPDEFASAQRDIEKWGALIRGSGLRPD
jgi:hypothetical protein